MKELVSRLGEIEDLLLAEGGEGGDAVVIADGAGAVDGNCEGGGQLLALLAGEEADVLRKERRLPGSIRRP